MATSLSNDPMPPPPLIVVEPPADHASDEFDDVMLTQGLAELMDDVPAYADGPIGPEEFLDDQDPLATTATDDDTWVPPPKRQCTHNLKHDSLARWEQEEYRTLIDAGIGFQVQPETLSADVNLVTSAWLRKKLSRQFWGSQKMRFAELLELGARSRDHWVPNKKTEYLVCVTRQQGTPLSR